MTTTDARPIGSLSSVPPYTELEQSIDKRLADLIETILPPAPYLQRIQEIQGRPLPQPSQQYYWWHGTPFNGNEQELQYLTFRPHAVGLLTSHGQWDDGNGGLAPVERLESQASSERTPLHGSAFKKKISLADYKSREKSRSLGKDAAPSVGSPRVAPATPESREVAGAEASSSREEVPDPKNSHVPSPQKETGAPAPREDGKNTPRNRQSSETNNTTRGDDFEDRPAKRRRLSDDGQKASSDASNKQKTPVSANGSRAVEKSDNSNGASSHRLKNWDNRDNDRKMAKSRQTIVNGEKGSHLPPMLSPTLPSVSLESLPPLLSPTFPTEIEDAYAETQRREKKERLKAQAAPASQSHAGPKTSVKSAAKGAAVGVRGVAQPVAHKPMEKSGDRVKEKLEKWFTIKIRRKDRKRIQECLKLPSNPNANYLSKPRASSARAEASSLTNDQPRLPMKKHMADSGSSNRDGILPNLSPETPRLPDSSPPAPNTPSHKKQRTSNATTSVAMNRAASGPGLAATPSGHSRHATPSTPHRPESSAAQNSEFERLVALGQELKHDSDRHLKQNKTSDSQLELGLAIAVESVLTFMLAGVVRDEPARRKGRAGNTTFWKGILPFLAHAVYRSHAFPRLSGLLLQLEGVIRDTLSYYYQLTVRAQAQDSTKLADIPSASAIAENDMQAAVAWRDGNNKLWIHQLIHAFPRSWKKAERKTSHGKGQDQVVMGSYRMDFALPMSVSTTGIEAVNAGLCLVREYCEWQNVDWKVKLLL